MRCGWGAIVKLEKIRAGQIIAGIVPGELVNVVAAKMRGDALELVYRAEGALGNRRLSRVDEDDVFLASDQTWWRPTAKILVALVFVVLIIGLAIGAQRLWTRYNPDPGGDFSGPKVFRTNGGLLEVATVKYHRTFNLTQMHVILGLPVPFCKQSASYTVDTYITYRVRLAKYWSASYKNPRRDAWAARKWWRPDTWLREGGSTALPPARLRVSAPRLEPSLPVAFDTSTLRSHAQKCFWMPDLNTQDDLLMHMSAELERDARSPYFINFARNHGAQDTVREFVQKWSWKGSFDVPAGTPIDVTFDDQ
jgi:hypothetical protein